MSEPEDKPTCEHERVLNMEFDLGAAAKMPKHAVRAKWPRFEGVCSCGYKGIAYASYAHYIAGDW